MITGDNPLTAKSIADESGVDDFLAEATPEDLPCAGLSAAARLREPDRAAAGGQVPPPLSCPRGSWRWPGW